MNKKRLLLIIGILLLIVVGIWVVIFVIDRQSGGSVDVDTTPQLDDATVSRLPVSRVDIPEAQKTEIINSEKAILEITAPEKSVISAAELLDNGQEGQVVRSEINISETVNPGRYLIIARADDIMKGTFVSEVMVNSGEKVSVEVMYESFDTATAQVESELAEEDTRALFDDLYRRYPFIDSLPEMTETYEVGIPDIETGVIDIRLFPTTDFDMNESGFRQEVEKIKQDAQNYLQSIGADVNSLDLRYQIADPEDRF